MEGSLKLNAFTSRYCKKWTNECIFLGVQWKMDFIPH